MRPIRLLVPANIHHHSGGNAYNAKLVRGMRDLGAAVEVVRVEGSWPDASAKDRRRFGSLVGAWDGAGPEPGSGAEHERDVVIVDGLVAVGVPDELEYAAKSGRETWVLAHMTVDETADTRPMEREARAMRAATGIVSTSSSTATILRQRHGLSGIHVALPGVEPAPLAEGSQPPRLIVVAAHLPNKDQLLTVEALALIKDLDWTAAFVGSDQADSDYAAQVRAAVTASGLEGRLTITGELLGDALEGAWNAADLSLLVSRAEAFGMVVTESLARGIPVVVRAGTGAEEALGLAQLINDDGVPRLPGAAVPLVAGDQGSPATLASVLRRWLEDPATREAWQEAALKARDRLPGWDGTAQVVLDALAGRASARGRAD